MINKTYSAKPTDIKKEWLLVDASGQTLGRLATFIADRLQGKHKPQFTKHIDCGDYVVVINSDDIKVSGNKMQTKKYYRHSGYPGSTKERTLAEQMQRDSTRVIQHAVKGMLPKNKLAAERLKRLKIFTGAEHTHEGQNPKKVEVK